MEFGSRCRGSADEFRRLPPAMEQAECGEPTSARRGGRRSSGGRPPRFGGPSVAISRVHGCARRGRLFEGRGPPLRRPLVQAVCGIFSGGTRFEWPEFWRAKRIPRSRFRCARSVESVRKFTVGEAPARRAGWPDRPGSRPPRSVACNSAQGVHTPTVRHSAPWMLQLNPPLE